MRVFMLICLCAFSGVGSAWARGAVFSSSSDSNKSALEVTEQALFVLNGDALFRIDRETNEITATLSLAEVLEAQQRPGEGEQTLPEWIQRYDADGDNTVTEEEAEGGLWRWLRRWDRNADGRISADEAQRQGPRMTRTMSQKPAVMEADGEELILLVEDHLYRLDAETLKPRVVLSVADPAEKQAKRARNDRMQRLMEKMREHRRNRRPHRGRDDEEEEEREEEEAEERREREPPVNEGVF